MMNMPIVIVISPQSKKDLQLPGRGNWGENLDYHHLQMDEVEINLWSLRFGKVLFQTCGNKLKEHDCYSEEEVRNSLFEHFCFWANFLREKIIPLNFVFWVDFLQSQRGEASLIHNKKHRQVTKMKDGQIRSTMERIGETVADFDSCKCPSVK